MFRTRRKSTEVCLVSFLSSNGRISVHFANIHLEFQYMPILRCAFTPKTRYLQLGFGTTFFHRILIN